MSVCACVFPRCSAVGVWSRGPNVVPGREDCLFVPLFTPRSKSQVTPDGSRSQGSPAPTNAADAAEGHFCPGGCALLESASSSFTLGHLGGEVSVLEGSTPLRDPGRVNVGRKIAWR